MRSDELAHHANAFCIVENDCVYSVFEKQVFRAYEVAIFSDNDARDAVQQSCAGAHDAGTESADQSQVSPVSSAACVAQANGLGMRCRISGLNSQVMPARHDLAVPVGED
jgi:hypothetical protein